MLSKTSATQFFQRLKYSTTLKTRKLKQKNYTKLKQTKETIALSTYSLADRQDNIQLTAIVDSAARPVDQTIKLLFSC